MSRKRRLPSDSLSSSPAKRCHLSPSSSPSTSSSYLYSDVSWPPPSDSPTNPFGRKRTYNLTRCLPPVTFFSKHLPLRLQIVNLSNTRKQHMQSDRDGVYRIVQVPLNYTFMHLRRLIGFLFGGVRVRALESGIPKRNRKSTAVSNEDEDETSGGGHVFEVKKRVTMYSSKYKPGQMRSGETSVKLSTIRDPYLYTEDLDLSSSPGDDEEKQQKEEEKEECTWTWEAEEDITVGHAWPRGADPTRGIIYHHTPAMQIHITINTTPLPRRKGRSNIPFIFRARGVVHLRFCSDDDRHASTPSKEVTRCQYTHNSDGENSDVDAEAEPDPECNHEDSNLDPDADDGAEPESRYTNIHANTVEDEPSLSVWNDPDAFARYLERVQCPPGGDELPSTTVSPTPSSPISSSSIFGIESSPLSTSPVSISSLSSLSSLSSTSSLFAFSKPTITPAPHPMRRLRIDHAQRRIVRLTRELERAEEDESDEEEVDELTDDEEDGDDLEAEGCEKARYREGRNPGELWDPFGDEVEL